MILGIIALVVWAARRSAQPWSAGQPRAIPRDPPRRELEKLRAFDPNFSLVVFDDFVGALYTEAMRAAASGKPESFAAYLAPAAVQCLRGRPLQGLSVILPGAIVIESVEGVANANAPQVNVELVIEANLARRDPATGAEQAIYTRESWMLTRAKGARSRTPDKASVFACPNCSAPLSAVLAGVCKHCGKNVATGAFDWLVSSISVLASETRGPMLTGDTQEEGTDSPTQFDFDAQRRAASLASEDPAFQWANFQARVNLIFQQFQIAWAARNLTQMRPFMSAALFATQNYWVSEYLRQRLHNITENPALGRVELVRVTRDAFFDAVTVRIFAQSLDYTLSDDTGAVVAGNRSRPRQYSEYWTLIRGRGVKGAAKTETQCPRCSAPLDVTMAGECKYCKATITTGQFDWVLSRIEQDEVYQP